ncbi:pyridoxal phosphate-dependent aminotransferase, partial [Bacteroidota bacterium]
KTSNKFKSSTMENNRRDWLKKAAFGVIGLGTAQFETFASETSIVSIDNFLEGPVLLNSNENPYGPSPLARKAMSESIHLSNRYYSRRKSVLISALAAKNEVSSDNILMGAGSTEVIDLVARFAAYEKGNFIIGDPAYDYWTDLTPAIGLSRISVPLTSDYKHDLQSMLKAIKPDTRLIYICNPNNPTGTICNKDELIAFVEEATKKTLVLIDEAYYDFTDRQTLSNIAIENPSLIITRTFSKIYGLAGARVGYAIGEASTIDKLYKLKSWANQDISVMSTEAALASLKDENFVRETYSLNEKARKYTIEQLEKLNIHCIPSITNFIYFSLANYERDFFKQLENNNIKGTRIYEEQGKWSRITIGTILEMEQFIRALK